MNFLPNTEHYSQIKQDINNSLEAVSNISRVKYSVNTEEDISSALDEIEADVSKYRDAAEKEIEKLNTSLDGLIQSDFHNALNQYNNTFEIFSSNGLHDIFVDNYDNFPFGDWVNADFKITLMK